MIRAIVLDLDGTLIDRNESIADRTREFLDELVEDGRLVCIATGRPFDQTIEILRKNDLGVGHGYPHGLICEERDIYFLAGDAYRSQDYWNRARRADEQRIIPLVRDFCKIAGESDAFFVNSEYLQTSRGFVELLFGNDEEAQRFCEFTESKVAAMPFRMIQNKRNVAIRSRTVGKEFALNELIRIWMLSASEVLAIGDSLNDMEMLKSGVQPATTDNGDRRIKAAVARRGGHVSNHCDSLGVADILAQIIAERRVNHEKVSP